MPKTVDQVELQQFFEIRTDLAAAVRDQIPSIIDFHLNELVAMKMHTLNGRLRQACIKTISEHETSIAVATA